MTAVHDCSADLHDDETLAPALHAAHAIWIRETDRFLLPVSVREGPFWDRWIAVRYLADQFMGQYRREQALLDELRPFLPHRIVERLIRDGERILRLQGDIDRVGRRRATARAVSVISTQLLRWLRCWCADIEEAAGGIPRRSLPEEGNRVVADFELYARTHS
jgi:hypothetical protein